jgi:hypothetical protein
MEHTHGGCWSLSWCVDWCGHVTVGREDGDRLRGQMMEGFFSD